MKRFSQRQTLLFFYGFDIALVCVLLLVLLPLSKEKNAPQTMTMRFIEPDDAAQIDSVELYDATEQFYLTMKRQNSVWTGTDSNSNETLLWPCDIQAVEQFLAELSKQHTLTKKAGSASAWSRLGVDNAHAHRVTFFSGDGRKIAAYWFGTEDPVTGTVPLRTAESQTVWETSARISEFLSGGADFWADPFIEPVCATGKTREQSERGLRRGRLAYLSPAESVRPVNVVQRIFDSSVKAVYSVYEKDGAFIIIPSFFSAENAELASISYRYFVSGTTLERFLEENDE
ncbi:MAG: hypothetical protein J6K96_08405 [Treponema sp.]|nr:hypothetical protein [Treponema sp.]